MALLDSMLAAIALLVFMVATAFQAAPADPLARLRTSIDGTTAGFLSASGRLPHVLVRHRLSADVLHQFIVDAAAKTAHARLGGLSVYHAKEGAIAVSATYGYPSESVGHVRIVPGAGIIGGVFASKKPLLVRDTTRVPGAGAAQPPISDRVVHGDSNRCW
jgi:hypothetical protein